jgi:ABC-2 type transport system permease protein
MAFIIKEFYHIWRDKRSLVILIGMPIVQILLFGFAITNEIQFAPLGIYSQSKDEVTSKLTSKLLASDYFQLKRQFNTYKEIDESFKKGEIKIALIFENEFGKKFTSENKANIQIIADATDPNTANTLINYIQSIILSFVKEQNTNNSGIALINTGVRMRFNTELKGVYLFVPGLITIILMLVSAMMTSISIAKEKETGTMELMLVSPMKPAIMIIAKVIPYSFLSFLNTIMILILGKFVFGVPIEGSLVLLLAECILFIFCALSLGILISSVTNSQQVALMISLVGLMLPSILLSGFIFPVENMPMILQIITNIIPARWFLIIVKGIMLKGVGLDILWKETLYIVGFTLLYTLISIKKFKLRLQ